jgi:hypothetical protein
LAALASPPAAATAWWQRPLQIFMPTWFQRTALGSNRVVHVPAALSLPDQYYVADADLARQLLQDEASSHPQITMDDQLVDFVGECLQPGELGTMYSSVFWNHSFHQFVHAACLHQVCIPVTKPMLLVLLLLCS